jgi:Omp85 superfamily domain
VCAPVWSCVQQASVDGFDEGEGAGCAGSREKCVANGRARVSIGQSLRENMRLLLAVLLATSGSAWAQNNDADGVPVVGSPTEGRAVPMEMAPRIKPEKSGEWVVLPIPKASPAIGGGLQLVGARFFKADPQSQPSVLGAGVGYYSSETWFAGAGGMYNFGQGRWRITGGAAYLDAKYDFYGIGSDAGDDGIVFPIRQTGTAVFAKVLRRVGTSWYLGAGYRYFDSTVTLRIPIPQYPDLEEAIRDGVPITSAGPTLAAEYDTRDLNTNPRTGSFVQFEGLFPTNSLASDETYQRLTIKANRYWPVRDNMTLAGRITACGASENTPFFDLCFLGPDNDIRGYTSGRYQDRSKLSTQAELRVQFAPRWGGVVFAGVGQVAADFDDMNSSNWLPGGGVGVRWMAAPANKVNIRADVAWGEGEGALFYLAIGEAF